MKRNIALAAVLTTVFALNTTAFATTSTLWWHYGPDKNGDGTVTSEEYQEYMQKWAEEGVDDIYGDTNPEGNGPGTSSASGGNGAENSNPNNSHSA